MATHTATHCNTLQLAKSLHTLTSTQTNTPQHTLQHTLRKSNPDSLDDQSSHAILHGSPPPFPLFPFLCNFSSTDPPFFDFLSFPALPLCCRCPCMPRSEKDPPRASLSTGGCASEAFLSVKQMKTHTHTRAHVKRDRDRDREGDRDRDRDRDACARYRYR